MHVSLVPCLRSPFKPHPTLRLHIKGVKLISAIDLNTGKKAELLEYAEQLGLAQFAAGGGGLEAWTSVCPFSQH